MSQSRKILRIFFKIWVFNVSRGSVWRLVRRWRFPSQGYLEIFAAYLTTLSRVELPVVKNAQKNFQNFWLQFSGDLLATYPSREKRVFCVIWSVFKTFGFFPRTFSTVHCLVFLTLSQTHRITLKNILIFAKYFMFFALDFLICELLLKF